MNILEQLADLPLYHQMQQDALGDLSNLFLPHSRFAPAVRP
jgi:hypothetical protein